jgi:hypothetical protein
MAEKNANALSKMADQDARKKLKGFPSTSGVVGKGTVKGASNEQRRKAKDS